MRIGVVVKNADLATACGMQITYKGQSCLKISSGTQGEKTVNPSVKFQCSNMNSVGRKFMLKANACSASGYKFSMSYTDEATQEKANATDFLETTAIFTGNDRGGYQACKVEPITATDDLYIASFSVYEAVTSMPYDDMEIDRGFVTLLAANETINDPANKISYTNGKADVELNQMYGGFGVAYNLKPKTQKINFEQYSQVALTITSEESCALLIQLYNNITGSGYWERTGSSKGGTQYFDLVKGTKTYTFTIADNLKGSLSEAEAIFIKYNPPKKLTDDDGTTETDDDYRKRVPTAKFTIDSIQII